MSAQPDETSEVTIDAILEQGGPTILRNLAAMVEQGHDASSLLALISYGSETPSVRVFNVRLLPIEDYAKFIERDYPEVARAVRDPLARAYLRVVVLADGFIHVDRLPTFGAVEDHAPVAPYAVNARGGGVA